MARGNTTEPEILAQVESALIAGQSPSVIARSCGLPRTTIISIRDRMTTPVEQSRHDITTTILPTKSLDDLLTSVLEDSLKALQAIARTAQSERYINGQSAAQIAALHERIANFSIQLLSAAAEPNQDNN
jgi:hypothetical protein